MPKSPQRAKKPAKTSKPKKAASRPDASQTALSIVETIIGGKLVESPKRKAKGR